MAARSNVAVKPVDRELVITRIFDAPRALVFAAWTEPEHIVEWSAPHGFTIPHCEGELRPGGAWRCCMRSPEGADLWLGGIYREIVVPERLVFTHAWDGADGEPGHQTMVTVIFEDLGGKTRLTLRQTGFVSQDSRDGHAGGWQECLERLEEHLATA